MTPDRFARYQKKRARYWPQIAQFFGQLPPPLFNQGLLLQHNLGVALSDTGQFEDILSRGHDHPLLYLHFWLLETAPNLSDSIRQSLEKHLFAAMVYTVAGVYTHRAIRDDSSNVDTSFIFLAQRLIQQADWHLSCLFPASAPFWDYHRQFWAEYSEAALADSPAPASQLALTKIPVTAIALQRNQVDLLPQLWQLTDHFNFIHQILQDVAFLRRDLFQGHPSYPIAKIRQALGLQTNTPLSPERALGAFILTGTAQTINRECKASLQTCREIAAALNLSLFQAHISALNDVLPNVFGLFTATKTDTPPTKPPKPPPNFFRPAYNPLPSAINMAERYLLADPDFRESWEVQRGGAFGVPEMTARVFPSGLIVEILSLHGHNMSAVVDDIFTRAQAIGFKYFDFAEMPPDTDDLGLLLRLHRYWPQPAAQQTTLQAPLQRLIQSVGADGQIPVWLTGPDTPRQSMALWGKECVAVEANVLLGLLDFDPANYEQLIVRAVKSLTQRWRTRGWGALGHYVPPYWLWRGFELLGKLKQSSFCFRLETELASLQNSLGNHLKRAGLQTNPTPQTAAFLSLAALSPGNTDKGRFDPRWQTLLVKTQRYDGSWAGEPLYSTPTRGELATWYSSRTVTTAFCYHALKTCQF
jgi:hypothetical protein